MLGALLALPGMARDFTYEYEGQTLTYTVLDETAKTCQTKAGNYKSGALVIPAVAKDGEIEYSVIEISPSTFARNSSLTSVTIPNSVTKIGSDAFDRCYDMTSVTIGNSVTEIGSSAFNGCLKLTSVTIPNSVTTIGYGAFNGCSALKELRIDDCTQSLHHGDYIFGNCPLETVYIGRDLSDWHLGGTEGLINLTIGNSVTTIGWGAFRGCSSLVSVIIGNSVTRIDTYAFSGCYSLTSVNIPNSVTEIGSSAFNGCSGLTSVTIPNSVTEIGYNAFEDCSGLTSVTIGNSVTLIYGVAFSGCSGLTSVNIPNSVTYIGERAFRDCSKLTDLTIEDSDNNLHFEENAFRDAGLRNVYLGRNFDYGGYYTSSGPFYGSGITELTISPNVTTFYPGAFQGCKSIRTVEIPNSVTTIGNYAFKDCSGLTSIVIPASVTEIGSNTFDGCSGLKKVAYPSDLSNPFETSVSAIEYLREGSIMEDGFIYGPDKDVLYYAPLSFEGEYVIPSSVTRICDYAFRYCTGLTSVVIPNTVIQNGSFAFDGCTGLIKSAYPSGLSNPFETSVSAIKYLRDGAIIEEGFVYGPEKNTIYFAPLSFEGEYVIPESVSEIGGNAFYGCSALNAVKATAMNPPLMNDNSFQGLYAKVALSVPTDAATDYIATNWSLFENLRIGDSEAAGQTYETGNLKYMLIPAKTEEDKNLAVVIPGNYSSLTEVTIPERFTVSENGTNTRYHVDGIGYKAFNGCTKLATVTFNSRNASKIIGDYAFAGTNISAFSIPETVEAIGNHAFDGCKSLASIVIPGSVETIGDYAFNNTNKLNAITLNEGLKSIGENAFSATQQRNSGVLNIPSTLQSIGTNAFQNFKCEYAQISALAAWCKIDFGNRESNPAKESSLYLNGEKIEDLVIPESVDAISGYAFYYNKALKSVKFNDALQSIGDEAFYNCSLPDITIPGNVTYIGKYVFNNIRYLTLAYSPMPLVIGAYGISSPISFSLDRPIGDMRISTSRLESLTIGNSVTEIPAAKFKGASKLTSLVLGNSLTAIGDEAFSGYTGLTEVILPPSVETIGASAFAGNSKLTSIIMGHKVTSIGEKAYNLCPAQTVSITAQTPPEAPDNTFSNYTGKLYVQGQEAAKAYYDADYCWYQFEGHVMIEPTEFKVEGNKVLSGKPGDTFQLKATLYPTDVTLPHVFWRSTNPDIATVDANGIVTLHADMSEIMTLAEGDDASYRSCKIIAESLYANGPVAEFMVNNDNSGIDDIEYDSSTSGDIDFTAPVEVYNLQGVMVSDNVENLANGIYIIRQGKNVKKIAVK